MPIAKIFKDGQEIDPEGKITFDMEFTKEKDFVLEIQNTHLEDEIVNPKIITTIDQASLIVKSIPQIIPPNTTRDAVITVHRIPLLALASTLSSEQGKAKAKISLQYQRRMKVFTS